MTVCGDGIGQLAVELLQHAGSIGKSGNYADPDQAALIVFETSAGSGDFETAQSTRGRTLFR